MATALDLPASRATISDSPFAAIREANRRKAEQLAAAELRAQQAAERAQAEELRQVDAARVATEAAKADNLITTASSAAAEWATDPAYRGTRFDDAPEEVRAHFTRDRYGNAVPAARIAWDSAQAQAGTAPRPNETFAVNEKGNAQRNISAHEPIRTGKVTERDLAEKGLDPTKIPESEWASALAAKLEPIKTKLDVQQKAALGAAAQAVPVLAKALAEYDTVNKGLLGGRAGPVAGNIETLKTKMGFGHRDFAKANSELRGNLFNIARSLQGAGVLTEQDIKRMEEISPSLRQTRDQFQGNVDAVKGLMRERLEAWRALNDSALDDSQRALVDRLITQTAITGADETGAPGAQTPNRNQLPAAGATPSTSPTPSPASIQMLIENPGMSDQFNERYGPGAAEKILNKGATGG